jgi:CPA2 family monovalent cation:H+ antiporter-2
MTSSSDEEVEHLRRLGAHHVVMGEREIADRMLGLAAEIRHRSKAAKPKHEGTD